VRRARRERTRRAQESSLSGSDGRADAGRVRAEPRVVGVAPQSAAGGESGIPLEGFGGARLFVSDGRVALLLLDRARYRVVERLFGVPNDRSWLVTLIALALVARAAHEKWDQMVRGPAGPTRSDVVLGVATVREVVTAIPGPSWRDTPLVGTLVTIALAGAVLRPGLSRTVRGIRASAHRARRGFTHRYGHVPAARAWTRPQDTRSSATTKDF
jgi:hypothetical protein